MSLLISVNQRNKIPNDVTAGQESDKNNAKRSEIMKGDEFNEKSRQQALFSIKGRDTICQDDSIWNYSDIKVVRVERTEGTKSSFSLWFVSISILFIWDWRRLGFFSLPKEE